MPRRNNGYRLRFLKKRGCYYIVWTEGGRSRERSTATANVEEAQEALREFTRAKPSRQGPREPSEVLITDILNGYALDRQDEVAAPVRIACAMVPLAKFFEGMSVQDVNEQNCKAFGKFRNRKPGTVRRDLSVLRAAINHAHRAGKIMRTVHVELPKSPPSRTRWLARGEVAGLLHAALRSPHTRLYLPLFIMIGVITGQRKEAILSLRWSQVDLINGMIDFRVPGRRETKKKRSRIQIPPRLMTHLRNARKRGASDGHVIHENGNPIIDIKNGFAGAVKRAGLAGTGVTPHTLRHTCATWLMQNGVSKWEAAGYLAMSTDTLENTYGHQHPSHYSAAGKTFSERPRIVRATIDTKDKDSEPNNDDAQ